MGRLRPPRPWPDAGAVTDPALLAATVIEAIDTPSFAGALDRALGEGAAFDLTATTGFPPGRRALLLHDGLRGISPPEVMQNYLGGTYLLDPAYTACVRGLPGGLYRMEELAPDQFFAGEYFNSPLVHPCISMQSGSLAEEVIFLVPLGDGHALTHSLMRSRGMRRFPDAEADWLRGVAPMVVAALAKHWRPRQRAPLGRATGAVGGDALQPILESFATGALTPREQAIVGLVLRGHSSGSVAHVLGISEGTVKNHRKHIHAKLGISGQAELFGRFVAHVLFQDAARP